MSTVSKDPLSPHCTTISPNQQIKSIHLLKFRRVGRNYGVYACLGGGENLNSFSRLLRSQLRLVVTRALQPLRDSLELWV